MLALIVYYVYDVIGAKYHLVHYEIFMVESHDLSRTGNKSSRSGGREHSREMTLTSGKEWTKMYKKGVRLVIRQFENEMKTAAVNYWERKSRKKTNLHKDRCLKTQ